MGLFKEGEELVEGREGNNQGDMQGNYNDNQGGNYNDNQGGNYNDNQGNNQGDMQQGGGYQDNQQDQRQAPQQQQGGGMMKSFEQNTGDAYVNQEVNGFLNKEGVPTMMDGAIDGAVDTEANKLEKDF